MHTVLTRAQIYRADRQACHHCLHLFEVQPIYARGIAVAERAGEVTFVGQAEPECEFSGRRRANEGSARCDVSCRLRHYSSISDGGAATESHSTRKLLPEMRRRGSEKDTKNLCAKTSIDLITG